VPVAEFGMGVSDCREEDGSALCTVAVAAGDDLVLVQLAPGDPAQGEELALGIVRLLLPAG
jgi:hypothetical protein